MNGNMLSLKEFKDKIKNLEGVDERKYDIIYLYSAIDDCYYTIDDIRIDSEDDIVIDINICD